jgi:HK97 family phage major capsid protein
MEYQELLAKIAERRTELEAIVSKGAEGWEKQFTEGKADIENMVQRANAMKSLADFGNNLPAELPQKNLKNLPQNPADAGAQPEQETPLLKEFKSAPFRTTFRLLKSHDENGLKSLQLTSSPLGGWYTTETMSADILPALKPRMVFDKLRTRSRTMVDDRLVIRRRTSRSSIIWQGESAAIATSQYLGSQLTMTAKYAALIIPVSNRLLLSSVGSMVEADIKQEMTEELALGLEYAYLYGVGSIPSGTGNNGAQPLGIRNASGINVFECGAGMGGADGAANGAPLSLQDVNFGMNMVERTNVPDLNTKAWLAHPIMKAILRGLVDEEGRHYFWDPMNSSDTPRLCGYPIYFTTQIPTNITTGTNANTTEMFFGEWGHFNIAAPSAIRFNSTTQSDTAFTQDETHFSAIVATDCLPSYAEAFTVITGINAA